MARWEGVRGSPVAAGERIMPECRRIVLTGGPGGGKSTFISELQAEDPRGERWLPVPEAASLLLSAGLVRGEKAFQQAVVRLQIALEDAVAEGAGAGTGTGRTVRGDRILLCDRGTVDSLAYWRLGGWDEQAFFDLLGMSHQDHLRRYFGVIHMQTSAVGAEAHYQAGPQTVRNELPEQAARIDALCAEVWRGHRRYALIENAGRDWGAKARAAREVLDRWLA